MFHRISFISIELFFTNISSIFLFQAYVQVSQEDYKCTFPTRQTPLGKQLLFYPIFMAGTVDSKHKFHCAAINSNFSPNLSFSFFTLHLFLPVRTSSCFSNFFSFCATIYIIPSLYLSIYFFPYDFSSIPTSVRKIADMYSAQGYYTIIPKQLNPNMEGGDDFDGKHQ